MDIRLLNLLLLVRALPVMLALLPLLLAPTVTVLGVGLAPLLPMGCSTMQSLGAFELLVGTAGAGACVVLLLVVG